MNKINQDNIYFATTRKTSQIKNQKSNLDY